MGTDSPRSRRESLVGGIAWVVRAVRDDEEQLTEAVVRLSRRRRIFAPLALCVGALAMLVEGMRLLLFNWRLLLIQILPAVWIWLAMLDLKVHVLKGESFHEIKGPVLGPIGLVIVAITIVGVFFNAWFAYAITGSKPPDIRAALGSARGRMRPVLAAGTAIGLALAVATLVSPRWGKPWFTLTLGIVVGVMMISYVAVPSRLIGVKPAASRRDKLAASLLSGAVSATVCTPPYVVGRIGILMLGSKALLIPGIFVMVLGFGLQAGATGAVRAVKLGASLAAGREPGDGAGSDTGPGAQADGASHVGAGTAAAAADDADTGSDPGTDAGRDAGAGPALPHAGTAP